MQNAICAPTKPGRLGPAVVTSLLKPMASLLRTGEEAATMDRLFSSQHVPDLQLIVAFACIGVILVCILGIPLSLENQWQTIHPTTYRDILHFLFAAFGNFLKPFGAVLAVFSGILAWAYQAGSARLGVVDLFACEISTLCRVVLVVDTVRHYVDRFDPASRNTPDGARKPNLPMHGFTSQENYFPVFENNARELEALEARVVINITAFYTYMKAVRDSQRALAEIVPQTSEPVPASYHDAMRNLVYMLFLGLESARHAISDLVEFEPEKAERTIVVLISELEAYRFLCGQFTDERDIRHQRLILRASDYCDKVPKLWQKVEAGMQSGDARHCSRWEPASRLVPELKRLYSMCPIETKSQAAPA